MAGVLNVCFSRPNSLIMPLQLLKSKSGVRRSDDIVNRLVRLCLETGAMTGEPSCKRMPAYCQLIYIHSGRRAYVCCDIFDRHSKSYARMTCEYGDD